MLFEHVVLGFAYSRARINVFRDVARSLKLVALRVT